MHQFKLVLIAVFIFLNFHFSKTQCSYILCENLYENYSCYLNLYNSKEYSIAFQTEESEDLIYSISISTGTFNRINDTLILKDNCAEFEIKLITNNNLLIVSNGLGWLINKKFIFENENLPDDSLIDNFSKTFSVTEKKEIRFNYKNQNLTEFPLIVTNYYAKQAYLIELKKDSTYNFKLDNILFSDGKWMRDGNILILNDSGLNTSFYILIGNNCLIPNQLFDLDSEMIFKME